MSHQRNLLQKIVERQIKFQKALQERVKDDKAKAKQIIEWAEKNGKTRPKAKTPK